MAVVLYFMMIVCELISRKKIVTRINFCIKIRTTFELQFTLMLRPNRWYAYTFTSLCAIIFAACKQKTQHVVIETLKTPGYGAVFKGDAGVIIKKPAWPYLIAAKLIDTTLVTDWSYTEDTDTIGKYYRLNDEDAYLACILDHAVDGRENLLLFETNPQGVVTKSFHYYYGEAHCCWVSTFDGFGRMGNYFFIRTCGTGTAMCTSDLYLFKTASPQEAQQPISEWYWMGSNAADPAIHGVSSVLKVQGDSVQVHYTVEAGVAAVTTDSFDVTYHLLQGRWVANDSTAFHNGRY